MKPISDSHNDNVWVEIPAGKVTLTNTWDDDEKVYLPKDQPITFEVAPFAITKYPVTNAQYARFIEAGGYKQQKWWTAAGWEQLAQEKWSEPSDWQDTQWNGRKYPVVGISWYETIAYCHWLSEVTGDKITLPTEQQWQRAAQGDTNWVYPWGEKFAVDRCNSSVSKKSSGTTPVTHYEGRGDSPFGVADLCGNVWEWCLTEYASGSTQLDGTNARVIRGGSWYHYSETGLRNDARELGYPHARSTLSGFRIARSYS